MHAFMAVVWLVFSAAVYIMDFRADRPISQWVYMGMTLSGIWAATA